MLRRLLLLFLLTLFLYNSLSALAAEERQRNEGLSCVAGLSDHGGVFSCDHAAKVVGKEDWKNDTSKIGKVEEGKGEEGMIKPSVEAKGRDSNNNNILSQRTDNTKITELGKEELDKVNSNGDLDKLTLAPPRRIRKESDDVNNREGVGNNGDTSMKKGRDGSNSPFWGFHKLSFLLFLLALAL